MFLTSVLQVLIVHKRKIEQYRVPAEEEWYESPLKSVSHLCLLEASKDCEKKRPSPLPEFRCYFGSFDLLHQRPSEVHELELGKIPRIEVRRL
ncbi:hypothetical protein D3C87_1726210 [compost metagenome]